MQEKGSICISGRYFSTCVGKSQWWFKTPIVLNFGGEHSSQLCISNKFLTPSFYLSRKEPTVYDEESLTFSFFFSSDKDCKSSIFVSLWHEDISKGKHFPFQAFGKDELVSYQLSLKWCNDSCWLLPDFK